MVPPLSFLLKGSERLLPRYVEWTKRVWFNGEEIAWGLREGALEPLYFKNAGIGGTKADLPQNQLRSTVSGYFSFPFTFVRSFSSAGYHFINGLFFISA